MPQKVSRLDVGACTAQPKSAIFSVSLKPMRMFSGLMSLWIMCFEWQYWMAWSRLASKWTSQMRQQCTGREREREGGRAGKTNKERERERSSASTICLKYQAERACAAEDAAGGDFSGNPSLGEGAALLQESIQLPTGGHLQTKIDALPGTDRRRVRILVWSAVARISTLCSG